MLVGMYKYLKEADQPDLGHCKPKESSQGEIQYPFRFNETAKSRVFLRFQVERVFQEKLVNEIGPS